MTSPATRRAALILPLATSLLVGCDSASPTRPPSMVASSSAASYGVTVQVELRGVLGSGQPSPLRVNVLTVRDSSGTGVPIAGGSMGVRDSEGKVLAVVAVPPTTSSRDPLDLAWAGTGTLARSLDLQLDVVDGAGVVHRIHHTLEL